MICSHTIPLLMVWVWRWFCASVHFLYADLLSVLSVFLSPFLLLIPPSLLWTDSDGPARTWDKGSVELASNMSAEGLEKKEVQQKDHKKRKRDRSESGEDELVPHQSLPCVMRRALKPSTNLERPLLHAGLLSVFLSPFLLFLPVSWLWTGGDGSDKTYNDQIEEDNACYQDA